MASSAASPLEKARPCAAPSRAARQASSAAAGRVARPAVLVALVLAHRRLDEGGGQVDRRDDGTGRRVGGLAGVDGHGLEAEPRGSSVTSAPFARRQDEQVRAGDDADRVATVEHSTAGRVRQALGGRSIVLALPTVGEGRPMTDADRLVEDLGVVQARARAARGRSPCPPPRPGPAAARPSPPASGTPRTPAAWRWRCAPSRRGERAPGAGSRSPLAASTSSTVAPRGPQEAVVGHPAVVVELGQVAPARVGHEDHDHVVGAELGARSPAPPTPRCRSNHRPGCPSSRVTRRAVRNESRSETVTTVSTTAGS